MMKNQLKKVIRSVPKGWVTMVIGFLLLSRLAIAQERSITGRVTSNEEGLPGVTVRVIGTNTGAVTDVDGSYSIRVSDDNATLAFSYIGFITQEVNVGSRTIIDVVLGEDLKTLEEVIVVGYGQQKKSDLTGAISSLAGDDLNITTAANFDQAMQGRLAGVQVTQNSGRPGAVSSIRIRGTTSLTQSSEPLYVVDGVQIGGQAGSSAGFGLRGGAQGQTNNVNPLSFINPNDIESIDVLKDASATAIYGSRAANGVVIITTKRGSEGKGTVRYDGFYSVQQVYKTYDMMNLREYAAYNNEVTSEVSGLTPNPRFQDPSLLGDGTDWQEGIFRVAPIQSHTLTFSGGTKATKYVLSGGYFSQDGVIINSGFDRLNLRLNVDSEVNNWLTIGTSMSMSRKNEILLLNDGGDGVVAQAAQMSPGVPVKNFDGSFSGPQTATVSAQVTGNPVALAELVTNSALEHRFLNNFYMEAAVIDGLKLRTELALSYSNAQSTFFLPSYQWGAIENVNSELQEDNRLNTFWLWKTFATYSRSFGKHDLTALVGVEAQRSDWDGTTAYKIGLPNDINTINQGEASLRENTGFKGWNSISSQFARLNYSFEGKYLVTATIRRDGSSRFGSNNRWGVFPSVSVGWQVMDEPFMPQNDIVTNLKFRAGWGQVGNENIPNFAFGSQLSTVITDFSSAGLINNRFSNRNVQWETTTAINIGMDLELFAGRLNLEAEAYKKQTDDLLLPLQLPLTFGSLVQAPIANLGSMENRGIELSLNSRNIVNGKLKWSTNVNLTVNRNKVLDLKQTQLDRSIYWYSGFQNVITTRENLPVGQFFGFVADGLFTSAEEILNHAVQIPSAADPSVNEIDRNSGLWLGDVKWKDLNGDGVIDNQDRTFIGDPNPDFTFGFNNSFEYGGWSLDVFLTGVVGGDILNYARARNEGLVNNFDNQSRTVLNRARTQLVEGGTDLNNINDVELVDPNATIPRFDNGRENNNHIMSTRWIEDGTYVRIQNVKLSYRLPLKWIEKIRASNVLVYVNIQNLATFTDYTGLDPQVGNFNQSPLIQNADLGRFPTPRLYTMGLTLGF